MLKSSGGKTRDNAIITYQLRDPFNMFASQMRSWKHDPPIPHGIRKTVKRLRSGFKEFAKEALGITHNLPAGSIYINYNRWFSDKSYRDELANKLGLSKSDKDLNTVTGHGYGSSFDKKKFNGHAQQMNVLSRWKSCAGNRFYISMFDRETISLSRRLFGPTPDFRNQQDVRLSQSVAKHFKHLVDKYC